LNDIDRRAALAGGALPLAAGAASETSGSSNTPVLRAIVEVGPPQIFGTSHGYERRCVPFLGGSVSGRVTGTILPGGTDWQRIFPDGTTELDAHYAILTADGATVEAHGTGLRSGSEAAMRDLLAGKPVDPALIYFRVAYRFVTDAPALHDLTTRLFIGAGRREPSRVTIDIFPVD
jgi:hypothetical protein